MKTKKTHKSVRPAPRSSGKERTSSPPVDGSGKPPTRAVVAMGASAGGVEAYQKFFQRMPPDSGMAFVLIPHLDPRHESVLAELLAKLTRMPVAQVHGQQAIRPDHVYVMAPTKPLKIEKSVLGLDAEPGRSPRMPIDAFFRSLAQDQGENAICIILSGTGSDGTLGLMAVKEHGGLAMAEATGSARFDSMPRSAIATGLVDQVLPVEDMPAKLLEYVRHLDALRMHKGPDGLLEDAGGNLMRILTLLKQRTGHDFAQYKKNTLLRRVQRRMQVVQTSSTGQYVELLRHDKREIDLLFRDLLIGVTHFFRDPEAFEVLGRDVVPRLFARKKAQEQVRVWVTACATGEEAYSVAILLFEQMEGLRSAPRVQIFATDIDDDALDFARAGVYPEGIAEQLSPERLRRFFTKEVHHYRITKQIRDMVIFSRHNVTRDPPFSRLDLICCRNLFIYLESDLQKKLIDLYHYALAPGGYLLLGSSENLSGPPSLFRTVDKKHRIYQRKPIVVGTAVSFAMSEPLGRPVDQDHRGQHGREHNVGATVERILLAQFAPASVIVDERGEILYFCGQTGKFLEPSTGTPSTNVISMARKGLRLEVRAALHQAAKSKKQVVHERLVVQTNGRSQRIDLIVRPLHELGEEAGLFIVVFRELQERGKKEPRLPRSSKGEQRLTTQLEGELRSTREHLQTTIEELETSNEELKSSNEELLSMNEELQSANEELQTSKEELQSVNEELETVNTELRAKVEEVDSVNSDLQNLMQSTQIATIFLDNSLRISRFTVPATELFRLIDTDLGRPIGDIASRFSHADLAHDIKEVLRTLVPRERKVRLIERETWYLLRICPYRTIDQVIQGVVLVFVDVTELERSRDQAAQLAAIVDFTQDAVFSKTPDGHIATWNAGAERMYGWTAHEVIGKEVTILVPAERKHEVQDIVARVERGEPCIDVETVRIRKDGYRVDVSLTCSPIRNAEGELTRISVIARDITQRKRVEHELRRANEALQRSNEDLKQLAYAASHDLQEPLRLISNYSQLLSSGYSDALDEKGRSFLAHVVSGSRRLGDLLRALQVYWSIERSHPEREPVNMERVLESALQNLKQSIEESTAEITHDPLPTLLLNTTPMLEVMQNLLGNAIKYRRPGVAPRIHVSARQADGAWEFSVSDNGLGVPLQHREGIFLPFKRLHGEKISGTGMGLAICSRSIERFGGRIWVEPHGDGSTFKFTVPRSSSP